MSVVGASQGYRHMSIVRSAVLWLYRKRKDEVVLWLLGQGCNGLNEVAAANRAKMVRMGE